MGLGPIFCLWNFMARAPDKLTELIGSVVEPMGFELVGVEYASGGSSGGLLRVYIDQEAGISVDDCADVSHQVSGVLDVEDPIRENYSLEVSSPGLDRPLFYKEHYRRFVGSRVKISLRAKQDGRRRFEGRLLGVRDNDVVIDTEDEEIVLPLDMIEKARLVPEF